MSAMNVILKHLITCFCHFEAFTLFCRKFAIVAIYAFFGVKFWPQKFRSCKKLTNIMSGPDPQIRQLVGSRFWMCTTAHLETKCT